MAAQCALLLAALTVSAVTPLREAQVVDGVLKWADSGEEVSLWGVNYLAPFAWDYANVRRAGLRHEDVIEADITHLRRLGIDYVRLHTFDTQFTDREGNIVETDHLRLLDHLIARLSTNGLYVVLTPIAWWNVSAKGADGFSRHWKMTEMVSNREARLEQCRYLKQFAERINRHTGRRYADEPAILAFELINEPKYPANWPDAEVTTYIDELAAALRSSGTRKPVFYSEWQKRSAAVQASSADGATNGSYPTGLDSGRRQAGRLIESIVPFKEAIPGKLRMVYEFDAADTSDPSLYPAFALAFRASDVQLAAQFQYDLLPLASSNLSWRTHYLNLVYTPARAMSLAIGREAMHRVRRGAPYNLADRKLECPPFSIDGEKGTAVMADAESYLSVGAVSVQATDPSRLRRVWGCGSSPLVTSTGNGCYFFDKVSDGVWRLQLYPSVVEVADPFSGEPYAKTLVSPDPVRLAIGIPDIGRTYHVWTVKGLKRKTVAVDGRVLLPQGDYLLTRTECLPSDLARTVSAMDIPEFVSPEPSSSFDPTYRKSAVEHRLEIAQKGVREPSDWRLDALAKTNWIGASTFAVEPNVSLRFGVASDVFADRFPSAARDDSAAFSIRLKADEQATRSVEVMFTTDEGVSYVRVVPVSTEWRTLRLPLRSFGVAGWSANKKPKRSPTISSVREMGFTMGRWLYPESEDSPHGIRFDWIRPSFGLPNAKTGKSLLAGNDFALCVTDADRKMKESDLRFYVDGRSWRTERDLNAALGKGLGRVGVPTGVLLNGMDGSEFLFLNEKVRASLPKSAVVVCLNEGCDRKMAQGALAALSELGANWDAVCIPICPLRMRSSGQKVLPEKIPAFDSKVISDGLGACLSVALEWNCPVLIDFEVESRPTFPMTEEYGRTLMERVVLEAKYHLQGKCIGVFLNGGGGFGVDDVRFREAQRVLISQKEESGLRRELQRKGIMAHQGDDEIFPGNTVEAFASAVAKGAAMIEFDVRRCKSGELILNHDLTIPYKGVKRKLCDLTLSELKSIDKRGCRIPTLQEGLAVLPKEGVWLNVHIGDHPGVETIVPETVEYLKRDGRLHQALMVLSERMMKLARERVPDVICTAAEAPVPEWRHFWTREEVRKMANFACDANCKFMAVHNTMLHPDDIAAFKGKGGFVNFYACNTAIRLESILESGVDFPCTDHLHEMQVQMRAVERAWRSAPKSTNTVRLRLARNEKADVVYAGSANFGRLRDADGVLFPSRAIGIADGRLRITVPKNLPAGIYRGRGLVIHVNDFTVPDGTSPYSGATADRGNIEAYAKILEQATTGLDLRKHPNMNWVPCSQTVIDRVRKTGLGRFGFTDDPNDYDYWRNALADVIDGNCRY